MGKCLAVNVPAVAAYINDKSTKFNIQPSDIKRFTELYLSENNTDTLPTDEQLIAYIEKNNLISINTQEVSEISVVDDHIITEANQFEKLDLLTKQLQLDVLQSIFYHILESRAKGNSLTKEFVKNNYDSVLNEAIPAALVKFNMPAIANNYPYLKGMLVASRLKSIGLVYEESNDNISDRNSGVESKSSVMFDSMTLAKDEVVFLFNTLFSENREQGIKLAYNYSDSWTTVMNLLGGTTTIDQQIQLLENSDLPFKDQILTKLGILNGESQNTEKYWKVRASFFEAFSKAKGEFHITHLGRNGNVFNALDSALKLSIKEKAKSKFRSSDYIKMNKEGIAVIKNPAELAPLSPVQFLQAMGFDIESQDMTEELMDAAIKMQHVMTSRSNISWLDDVNLKKRNKDHELKGYLNSVLEALVIKERASKRLMVRNAEGESQSSVHNHSYFTRLVNKLKTGLVKPFNMLTKNIAKNLIDYTIISGATTGKNSKSFKKLNPVDLYNTAITNMFSNSQFVFSLPRTSDKSLEQGISIKRDKNATDELGKKMSEKEFMSQFVYYGGEGKAFIKEMYDRYLEDLQANMPEKFVKDFKHPKVYWEQLFDKETLDPLTIGEFTDSFRKAVDKAAKDVMEDMKKVGAYQVKVSRYNKEYLKTIIPQNILNRFTEKLDANDKKVPFTKLSLDEQLAILNKVTNAYAFNSMFYGYEVSKMLYGNFTGTKSPEDFFKRTPSAIAETRSPNLSPDFVNWLKENRLPIMKNFPNSNKLRIKVHSETESSSNKDLVKLTDGMVNGKNPYKANNVDDGQGKIHFGVYRELNMLINNWTDSQDRVYNKLMKGQKLNEEDQKVTFPPLKPVGFDVIDDNGTKVPVFLKLAAYPIIPGAVLGTMNEETYNTMNEKGIGLIGPTSILKLAKPKVTSEYVDGKATDSDESTFEISTEGFGIQVDINPKNSFKQIQGTQIRKLIQINLIENGVPSKEAKEWIEKNNDTINKLAAIEKDNLFRRINKNGKIDNQGLKDLLKSELMSRGASSNYIKALEYLFNGETKLLDDVPNRKKLMNIINSLVSNRIVSLYTNGSTLVQISQSGWELKPGSDVDTPTGIEFISKQAKQNYIDNNGLSFITWNKEDKKIGAAEVIIPAKYKPFVKTDAEGNMVIDDEKVLTNIGYRIPTQGLNSILHLKVIGFLPSYMEQVIIMPKEITSQSGSDFDVDKVNLYIPNTIEHNGKILYIDHALVENASKIYNDIKFEGVKAIEADLKKYETEEEKNEAVDEYLRSLSSETEFKKSLEKKALQNDLISQSLEILENGELTLKQLLTPNSSDKLSDIATKIYGKESKFNYGTLFAPKTLIDITNQMYAAKSLVSIFASQSVHHSLGQQTGLHMKTTRPFYFDHNKMDINGEKVSSLAGIYKVDGSLISEMIGNQYLTASVDAAKDPFLFTLGVNGITANAVCLFERLGGDTEYLMRMLSQPLIKEYLEAKENANSLSFDINGMKKGDKAIVEEILSKHKLSIENYEFYSDSPGLAVAARENEGIIDLTKPLTIEQQAMLLDDFLYLSKAGRLLSDAVSNTKFDTQGGGKDVIQTELIANNYVNFVESSQNFETGIALMTYNGESQEDYSALIEKTFIKTFKDNVMSSINMLYNNMVMIKNNEAVRQLVMKFNNPEEGISSKKLSEDDADVLYEGVLNYIVQNAIGMNQELFIGSKSVASRIVSIQQDISHPLHDMYLFQKLFSVEASFQSGAPSIITLADRFIDTNKQESIEQEFAKLKELAPELYNDMIIVSMFQSGFTQSPSSFNQLLPYKDTIDLIQPILSQFSDSLNSNEVIQSIASNIGTRLTNLVRTRLKSDEGVFGSQIALDANRSSNKDLLQITSPNGRQILMYKRNVLASENSEIGVYDPIQPSNIRSLFTNYTPTTLELEISENEEETEVKEVSAEEIEIPIPVATILPTPIAAKKISILGKTFEIVDGVVMKLEAGIRSFATPTEQNQYLAWFFKKFVEYGGNKYYVLPKNVSASKSTEVLDSKLKPVEGSLRVSIINANSKQIKEIAKELYLKYCS